MIFCACSSLSLDKAHAYGPLRVQFKAVPVHCLAVGHAFWGTRLRLGPIPSHHGRAFWGSWLWYTHSFQGAVFRGSGLTTHLCPTTNNSCNLCISSSPITVCASAHVYTYIHLCKDVCVYIYNQMQMCAYVSVSTHMCIFLYIYIGVNKSEVEIYVCIYGWLSKLGSLFGYPKS